MSQTSFDTRGSNALSTMRARPCEPAPDTAIFERLPIAPAEPFNPPRLRLVVEDHREGGRRPEGGRRDAAVLGRQGGRVGLHQPRRTPVRLTRRGRLVMVITFALVTTAVVFALGLVPSQASTAVSGGAPSGQRVPVASVVVQPGDTLWSIATRVAPGTDPRVTVQRIIDRNALPDAAIEAGQVLVLPS